MKVLTAFVVMFLSVAILSFSLGAINSVDTGSLNKNTQEVLAAQDVVYEDEFTSLINKARVDGVSTKLSTSTELNDVAKLRANDMVLNDYYSHESPTGVTFENYLNGKVFACENLQLQTSNDKQSAVDAWLSSSSHRGCLMNSSVTEVGTAVVEYDTVYLEGKYQTTYIFVMIASS